MKFLLDTNFLVIPAQFRVDVFKLLEEFGKPELFTLDLCIKELKQTPFESLTQDILRKRGVVIEKVGGGSADFELEKIAKEKGMTVCTQDRELIQRLKYNKIPVVTLRQKKYLVRV